MVPKINIKFFDNELYRVIGSEKSEIIISYHDIKSIFNNQSQNIPSTLSQAFTPQQSSVNVSILHKKIVLDSSITVNFGYSLINDNINAINVFNQIKDTLDKEFLEKAVILGEKHRKENISFDINLKKIKSDSTFIYRLINSSHYISKKSKLGPSNFFVSNEKTYEELYNKLISQPLEYDSNNNLLIAKTPFLINKNVEDNIILTGRKNELEFGGLYCFINMDENNNINLIKLHDMMSNSYKLRYKIVEVGINAYENYLNINTDSISYYRRKKLEKINNANYE